MAVLASALVAGSSGSAIAEISPVQKYLDSLNALLSSSNNSYRNQLTDDQKLNHGLMVCTVFNNGVTRQELRSKFSEMIVESNLNEEQRKLAINYNSSMIVSAVYQLCSEHKDKLK